MLICNLRACWCLITNYNKIILTSDWRQLIQVDFLWEVSRRRRKNSQQFDIRLRLQTWWRHCHLLAEFNRMDANGRSDTAGRCCSGRRQPHAKTRYVVMDHLRRKYMVRLSLANTDEHQREIELEKGFSLTSNCRTNSNLMRWHILRHDDCFTFKHLKLFIFFSNSDYLYVTSVRLFHLQKGKLLFANKPVLRKFVEVVMTLIAPCLNYQIFTQGYVQTCPLSCALDVSRGHDLYERCQVDSFSRWNKLTSDSGQCRTRVRWTDLTSYGTW